MEFTTVDRVPTVAALVRMNDQQAEAIWRLAVADNWTCDELDRFAANLKASIEVWREMQRSE